MSVFDCSFVDSFKFSLIFSLELSLIHSFLYAFILLFIWHSLFLRSHMNWLIYCLCRDSQWHSDRYRWSDSDGPHCVFGVWSGSGSDAHQHGDRALHSDHHRCGHLPGCVLLHPVTHSGLHLVRGRHLPHRYYCRQCSRGPVATVTVRHSYKHILWYSYALPFKCLGLVRLFSKGVLNISKVTVKAFLVLQNIHFSNKYCFFRTSSYKRILEKCIMVSEGWRNGCWKSSFACTEKQLNIFENILNRKQFFSIVTIFHIVIICIVSNESSLGEHKRLLSKTLHNLTDPMFWTVVHTDTSLFLFVSFSLCKAPSAIAFTDPQKHFKSRKNRTHCRLCFNSVQSLSGVFNSDC